MLNITKRLSHTCGLLVIGAANAAATTPSVQGQSGYINMPSAWVEADGTFSTGYSYDRPYGNFWASATLLPALQVTGRYVSISGIPGFTNEQGQYGSNYGRYKDKVLAAKLQVIREGTWTPALALGASDLFGTERFRGQYVVASKTLGSARNVEASVGYGRSRPDGVFAGVRWAPLAMPGWALVGEYDATDYASEYRAADTAAGQRRKGPVLGVEYRWGWLGAQVARHRDHFSANAYLSIPFGEREFFPKFQEPPYFNAKEAPAPVGLENWRQDPQYAAQLTQALIRQDFRNVRLQLDGSTLKLSLTNNRISNLGRAVGRAARTALAYAPVGTRSIYITYTKVEQPIATYEFIDLARLSDYLTGLISRDAFLPTVLVRYAGPEDAAEDRREMAAALQGEGEFSVRVGHEGDMVQLRSEDREASRFKIAPKLGFFFNDPSGALRYDISAAAYFDRRLGQGLYLNGALKLNLLENVSGVTQESNSLLPHVRTDVAEYFRGNRLRLNRLLLSQYLTPSERVYARLSGGFYEDMYRGIGGQVLYLPKDSRWAADVSVDALQQRGFKGWFDKRDYQTVTALGALHYRLPYDTTVTARAGRFLARDTGVRLEFKRQLVSGVEIGAWYTRTNGNDITSPGSPANPYHDKGVFFSVPLRLMLPSDTQAVAGMSLSPWTRDVGQMVTGPNDLYDMLEQPRRDMGTYDGLGNFAERADEQHLAAVNPPVRTMPSPWPAFRWRLEQSVSSAPRWPEWLQGSLLAGGALAGAGLLDKPVDRFVQKHEESRPARAAGKFGSGMPFALAGAAGAAILFGEERMQNIGLVSLQSVAGAGAVALLAKRAIGRARPSEGLGSCRCTSNRSDASFPSTHSAIAFAAVTPFAREYNAPWLYGVAAAAAAGRVASREHWVSDAVGGSIVGYAVGSWLWRAQRDPASSRVAIVPGARELGVAWSGTY